MKSTNMASQWSDYHPSSMKTDIISAPVATLVELWLLRKTDPPSSKKQSWSRNSQEKLPFASDEVLDKLQELRKKESGLQAYQSLSKVRKQLIDSLVKDKNSIETSPFAEWTFGHVEIPDLGSKSDKKDTMYVILERRDRRGTLGATKQQSKSKKEQKNIIDLTQHFESVILDNKKSPVTLADQETQSWRHVNEAAQGWERPEANSVPPPPPFHSPSPYFSEEPPTPIYRSAEPQVHAQHTADTQIDEGWPTQIESRQDPAAFPTSPMARAWPSDQWSEPADRRGTGKNTRLPISVQKESVKHSTHDHVPQENRFDPAQVRIEQEKAFGSGAVPSMRGGGVLDPPYKSHFFTSDRNPGINTPSQPSVDPIQSMDWAEFERWKARRPSISTDMSDEPWSNATSGQQSTVPTHVSQESYDKQRYEDVASPSQPKIYRPDSYRSVGSRGSKYSDDRHRTVEPSRTQHRSSGYTTQHRESRKGHREPSPRITYSRRSPSHSPPRRHRDRRGRSPSSSSSSSSDQRSDDHHRHRRYEISPVPGRREPREERYRRDSPFRHRERRSRRYNDREAPDLSPPPRRDRAERSHNRHSRGERSPTYRDRRDRRVDLAEHEEIKQMFEAVIMAAEKLKEEDRRKEAELEKKSMFEKLRAEFLTTTNSPQAPAGGQGPYQQGGY